MNDNPILGLDPKSMKNIKGGSAAVDSGSDRKSNGSSCSCCASTLAA
ncbi:MAG TPA: hypothetical protein VNS58_00030 [Puia sp.]|nr:hypothetical protein [Puia sp.]